jgi:hypothetical protein
MVKVSELRGQMPEGTGARPSSLRDLQRLIVPDVRSITPHHGDVGPTFGDAVAAFEKTQELFLAKRSWGGFGVVQHQINGFLAAAAPTGFRALVGRTMAAQVGFHTQMVRLPTLPKPTLPKLPPEVIECIRAQKALNQGDENTFWRFVEEQLGRPPDDLLREVLDLYFLPHVDRLPSWVILRLLEHHRRRLSYGRPEKWHAWLAGQVFQRLRKHPNHRLMRALRTIPGSPHERLKLELPKAVAVAEREGLFGGYFGDRYSWHNAFMLRDVERQIVDANRLLRDTRARQKLGDDEWDAWDMVISLEVLSEQEDKPFLNTPDSEEEFVEEEFARLEDERRRRRYELSKGLPPKERELMHFIIYLYDQEKHGDSVEDAAAQYLGKSPSSVRSQVHRMKQHFAS